jgi:hypothetical protein
MAAVQSPISRSSPSNGSVCHNIDHGLSLLDFKCLLKTDKMDSKVLFGRFAVRVTIVLFIDAGVSYCCFSLMGGYIIVSAHWFKIHCLHSNYMGGGSLERKCDIIMSSRFSFYRDTFTSICLYKHTSKAWVRSFWSVTLWNENEVEVPSSVINHGFFIIIQFLSPLHVSALSGHPQKERGKLLMYQDQPVITNPIPHSWLLSDCSITNNP